jgi:hypothetical protein
LVRLQGRAGRIVRDKRLGWEYLLLSELMEEEIRLAKCQQVACSGGVEGRFRGANAAAGWVRNLLEELELTSSTQSWDELSALLATALGRPGEPGDPEAIASAVHKLAVAYGAMLRYRDRLRTVRLDRQALRHSGSGGRR